MLRTRVRDLIGEVLGIDPATLPENPTPDDVAGWDSAHHLELLMLIEEDFEVEVPPDDVPALTSLDAIVAFLERNGVAATAGAAAGDPVELS